MILDIKMVEINGFELYDKLTSRDSNIKTLFITALNQVEPYNTRNIKVYPLKGIRHFIKKPVGNDDESLFSAHRQERISNGEDVYQIG